MGLKCHLTAKGAVDCRGPVVEAEASGESPAGSRERGWWLRAGEVGLSWSQSRKATLQASHGSRTKDGLRRSLNCRDSSVV